jgi:hypothetical protein
MAGNPSCFNTAVDLAVGMKLVPEPILFIETPFTKVRLPPVAGRTKDGKPYTRSQHVDAELRKILPLDRRQWAATAESLQNETLVCLIRFTHGEDPVVCARIIEELQKRVAHRAERFCREMDEYDKEQFINDIDILVLERVLVKDTSRATGILEVAFGRSLKNLIIDEFEKFKRSTEGNIADLEVGDSPIDGLEEDEQVERPIEFLSDPRLAPEGSLLNVDMRKHRHRLLHRALKAVEDPQHRKAAILHWGRGWPVHSCKRGQDCLTKEFRQPERQIKYWLKIAMGRMRASLGVQI